jgi:predicted transcriptional regulator of viral defense system
MAQASTFSKLAQIAEDQWGLVTRRQAEKAGVSPATLQRLSADGSVLERVAHGVYHLAGAPTPDHVPLRAAWLQLAPDTLAWERTADQGVVSHRSGAALYGLGHLPADQHEFTLPERRQPRRPDVRVHRRGLTDDEWIVLRGLPVTRPSRIAADLLTDREDPEAVGQVVADALRKANDYAGTFVQTLAPHAAQLGLRRGDGVAVLRWLLDLVGDPETPRWMEEARAVVTDITPQTDVAPSPQSGDRSGADG